jgi:hypothetical protein
VAVGAFRHNKHVLRQAKHELTIKERPHSHLTVSLMELKALFEKDDLKEAEERNDKQQRIYGYIYHLAISPLHIVTVTYLGARVYHNRGKYGVYIGNFPFRNHAVVSLLFE